MNHAIAYLFSGHLVNTISHTLVHSLWQGALLSAITGLIMAGTRKSLSALRYNLLVSAIVLFAVTVAGTFYFECNNGDTHAAVSTDQPIVNSTPVLPETIRYHVPTSSITQTIGSYLNRYGAIFVWVWLLIVCARCVQLATGLREVYRLRHKNTSGIGSYWEEQVRQLCGQLGIKRPVGIAQSGRAKTPMVIGHLKPLILIPLSMLTSLSMEEAEAVLLHELAHIRRSDYMVNLLQNIMEIIFFFNPAVLWLSALIKAERENCCDDIAVARSGKVNYLKALVACEEYKMLPLPYAMALHTRNSSLKKRVARIISHRNESLNRGQKSLLAICLIAVGIFAMAFANSGKTGKQAMAANAQSANEDTVLAKHAANTTANIDDFNNDTTKHPQAATQLENPAPAGSNQNTEQTRAKSDSERTKSMISDLVKDGIITSTDSVSFKIGTDEFVVNYQKQPETVYQKYRAKYVATQYSGSDDWVWYYAFDSHKWALILSHKYNAAKNTDHPQTDDATTGVFKGKFN